MRPTVNGNRTSDRRESRKFEDRDYLPASMEAAAQEAAIADGIITGDTHDSKSKKAALRRGKWTSEEEAYANRLIYEFKLGLLPLNDGTTLRTFLSKLLNCDPMRISKKFVGQNCIGKQVFRRRQQDLEKLTTEQIALNQKELEELERKFLERVAQTNRSKSSGLKGFSDGRGYEDENGNTVLLPWMIPPEDNGEMSLRAAQHLAAAAAASAGRQGHMDNVMYSQQPAQGASYSHTGRGPVTVGGGGNNQAGEAVSMEQYQQMNGATMNHFMSTPAGQQYQYMQTLALHQMRENGYDPAIHGAVDNPYEALMQMHAQDSHLQLPYGLYLQPSGIPNSSEGGSHNQPGASTFSLGFTGTGQEWPSMNSLINAGESMENIAMFLAQYQTANSESNLLANNPEHMDVSIEGTGSAVKSEGKKVVSSEESSRNRSKSIDDVGLSLDDGHPAASSSSQSNGGAFPVRGGGCFKDKKPPLQFRPDQVRYSLPTDTMAAMAQMYGGGGTGSAEDRSKIALSNFSTGLSSLTPASKAPGHDGSSPKEGSHNLSSSHSGMPRNSSIENFWMLVDMGDLPRPEQDVLSEAVFAKNKAKAASSRSNDQHADDANNNVNQKVTVPIVPSSSLAPPRYLQQSSAMAMSMESSSSAPTGSLMTAEDDEQQQVGRKRATEGAIPVPSHGNAHPDTLQSLSQGDRSVSHEHLMSAFSSHRTDSPFQSMKKIKIEPTDNR